MKMNKYQKKAHEKAAYGYTGDTAMVYCILGMQRGLGELSREGKRLLRSEKGRTEGRLTGKINHELGNILWYLAELSTLTGIKLNRLAKRNLENL